MNISIYGPYPPLEILHYMLLDSSIYDIDEYNGLYFNYYNKKLYRRLLIINLGTCFDYGNIRQWLEDKIGWSNCGYRLVAIKNRYHQQWYYQVYFKTKQYKAIFDSTFADNNTGYVYVRSTQPSPDIVD